MINIFSYAITDVSMATDTIFKIFSIDFFGLEVDINSECCSPCSYQEVYVCMSLFYWFS